LSLYEDGDLDGDPNGAGIRCYVGPQVLDDHLDVGFLPNIEV
jgi:hypothetical protein